VKPQDPGVTTGTRPAIDRPDVSPPTESSETIAVPMKKAIRPKTKRPPAIAGSLSFLRDRRDKAMLS